MKAPGNPGASGSLAGATVSKTQGVLDMGNPHNSGDFSLAQGIAEAATGVLIPPAVVGASYYGGLFEEAAAPVEEPFVAEEFLDTAVNAGILDEFEGEVLGTLATTLEEILEFLPIVLI